MTSTRFHVTRFYLSGRSRGWDLAQSLRYALDRTADNLYRSFR